MDPENPGVCRFLSDLIGVFDGKLRLPSRGLALDFRVNFIGLMVYPTPPRPTSATRDAGLEHF
jgi:hypothetical protein